MSSASRFLLALIILGDRYGLFHSDPDRLYASATVTSPTDASVL
jgi:hypothetical protein